MIFRQFEGLFPMPVYFEVGVPQSFAWHLLSRYITSCPSENKPIQWNVSVESAVSFASFFPLRLTLFSNRFTLPSKSSTDLLALTLASKRRLTPAEALVSIAHYIYE